MNGIRVFLRFFCENVPQVRICKSAPRPPPVRYHGTATRVYSYLDLGEDEVEVRGGQLFADQLAILYQSNRTICCRGERRGAEVAMYRTIPFEQKFKSKENV